MNINYNSTSKDKNETNLTISNICHQRMEIPTSHVPIWLSSCGNMEIFLKIKKFSKKKAFFLRISG